MNFKSLAIPVIFIALLVISQNAVAEETNKTPEIDLEMIKDFYNNNIQSYSEIADLFADERLNIYIEGYGNVGVVTENKKIKEISEGELENPTVKINSDMETIRGIIDGEISIVDEFKSGD
ncbi:MAG: hypothetical protein V3U72_00090, partial [Candidatus Aenigmarchaeota archaeon]